MNAQIGKMDVLIPNSIEGIWFQRIFRTESTDQPSEDDEHSYREDNIREKSVNQEIQVRILFKEISWAISQSFSMS